MFCGNYVHAGFELYTSRYIALRPNLRAHPPLVRSNGRKSIIIETKSKKSHSTRLLLAVTPKGQPPPENHCESQKIYTGLKHQYQPLLSGIILENTFQVPSVAELMDRVQKPTHRVLNSRPSTPKHRGLPPGHHHS
jgi:hypothetical protein